MRAPLAYGIDFGTTNSLVSVAYEDRVDLLLSEAEQELMPSVVYLHRDGIEQAGEAAIRTYGAAASYETRCGSCDLAWWDGKKFQSDCKSVRPGGSCHNGRLVTEVKRFLSDEDLDHTHSWGRDFMFSHLASVVLAQLKRRADSITGFDVKRAVVGHPVAFAGTEGVGFRRRQQLALQRLESAAFEAGLTEIQLLEEPAAAVSVEEGDGIIVVTDFGGGTFDVMVIEMRFDRGVVRAMEGAAIGGEDFDEQLFRAKLWPVFGLDRRGVSIDLREQVSRRGTAIRVLSDRRIAGEIARLGGSSASLKDVLYGGHMYGLFRAIENAKIALSNSDRTTIAFDRPGIRIAELVSRAEFEALISNDIDIISAQIERALAAAEIGRHEVDLVIRTGGSSEIPLFVERLEQMFGQDRVRARPAYSSVALGLALHARKVWL